MLGLRCCTGFSLVVKSGGYSLVVVCVGFSLRWLLLWGTGSRGHRLSGTQASAVATHGRSRWGSWALEHRLDSCSAACGIFLHQGIESVSLALAGGFFTTEPPGKPHTQVVLFTKKYINHFSCTQCTESPVLRRVSCIAGGFFMDWATREAYILIIYKKPFIKPYI